MLHESHKITASKVIKDVADFVSYVTPAKFVPAQGEVKWPEQQRSQRMQTRFGRFEAPIAFRGQGNAAWVPLPKVDRPLFRRYRELRGLSRVQHEHYLINEFKKGARPYLTIEPRDDWEWLAIAQHYGLATRFLDWTSNPLAALFFAVEDGDTKRDAAVWINNHHGQSSTLSSPYLVKERDCYHPSHIANRIVVQSGSFTVHGDEPSSWDKHFEWVSIPRLLKPNVRDQLVGLGITRASLFPDLDGLAMHMNMVLSENSCTSSDASG